MATLGAGDAERGWQLTMVVWGVLAAAAVRRLLRHHARAGRAARPSSRRDFKRDVADLFRNGPWMVMFLLGLTTLTAFILRGQTTAYFFKYYVGNEALTALFISSGMIASIVGLRGDRADQPAGRRQEEHVRRPDGAVGPADAGVLPAAGHLAHGASSASNIVIALVQAPNSPLVWAMYADTADYGEWKFGRRNTGLTFAAAIMAQKGGGAVAGVVNGALLAGVRLRGQRAADRRVPARHPPHDERDPGRPVHRSPRS